MSNLFDLVVLVLSELLHLPKACRSFTGYSDVGHVEGSYLLFPGLAEVPAARQIQH